MIGKIIITVSFRVGTSKNEKKSNIEVTYEGDHISLLRNWTMPSALNFCFYLFYYNLKEEDHIRRSINSKKTREISIIILTCGKLVLAGPLQQKNKLPSPKRICWNYALVFCKNELNFDEAERSYFLKVFILRMYLFLFLFSMKHAYLLAANWGYIIL